MSVSPSDSNGQGMRFDRVGRDCHFLVWNLVPIHQRLSFCVNYSFDATGKQIHNRHVRRYATSEFRESLQTPARDTCQKKVREKEVGPRIAENRQALHVNRTQHKTPLD